RLRHPIARVVTVPSPGGAARCRAAPRQTARPCLFATEPAPFRDHRREQEANPSSMQRLIFGVSRSPFLHVAAAALLVALPGCADRVRVASENYNSRISVVVIHHTAENFADSLGILTKRSANPVSSHYLIPEPDDPTYGRGKLEVYELVPERYRAWHAGDSYWGGRTALNDQSIGIELVNRTHCHAGAPID